MLYYKCIFPQQRPVGRTFDILWLLQKRVSSLPGRVTDQNQELFHGYYFI